VSASLEAYLARLYLDADARRAVSADPRGAAMRAGLDDMDAEAVAHIDRAGLELTASSLQARREDRRGREAGWWMRLRRWLRR
jgi:hypothetical protein